MKNEKKASEFECRQTWAFGGPVSRRTLSRDGIVFDKTRMIFYDHGLNSGGHFQTGKALPTSKPQQSTATSGSPTASPNSRSVFPGCRLPVSMS